MTPCPVRSGMKINDQFKGNNLTQKFSVCRKDLQGKSSAAEVTLLSEHSMDVYINDILTMKLTCTADHLTELVLGRLLSEGIIRSLQDVDSLYICETGSRARVFLSKEHAENKNRTSYVDPTPTCCTDNRILNDRFALQDELQMLKPGFWSGYEARLCSERFDQDSPLHADTLFTHVSYLLVNGEIVFEAEDIGRHNALDKVLGHALLQGADRLDAAVFISGRVPTDMVRKVIRAGIPVFIMKSGATREAVELANRYGLTLIGNIRSDSYIIYTENDPKERTVAYE